LRLIAEKVVITTADVATKGDIEALKTATKSDHGDS